MLLWLLLALSEMAYGLLINIFVCMISDLLDVFSYMLSSLNDRLCVMDRCLAHILLNLNMLNNIVTSKWKYLILFKINGIHLKHISIIVNAFVSEFFRSMVGWFASVYLWGRIYSKINRSETENIAQSSNFTYRYINNVLPLSNIDFDNTIIHYNIL